MKDIEIITQSERIENLFEPYKSVIGNDYLGYRNHVYRTLSYAMHFLEGNDTYRTLIETALVYHDIALWTDKACAYLEPSEKLAVKDNIEKSWSLDSEALRAVIHWHHKITTYKGPHKDPVEAVRKADWIDANRGKVRKGMQRIHIEKVEAALPNEGFHQSLVRLAGENGGSTMKGLFKVTRGIMKW
ncbi:MAG: phosphohydrolase [Spirochaetota bacterium]